MFLINKEKAGAFWMRAAMALLILGVVSKQGKAQKEQARPNIIFIMADDQAMEAISSYGAKLIKTPNIDRIAKAGTRFTNCFTVSSLCAPSRGAIISGRYCSQSGMKRIGDVFDGSQPTFPKSLQKAGYETAIIGKWHLNSQPTGFDYYSVMSGLDHYYNVAFKETGKKWDMDRRAGEIYPGYVTDVITNKAINWLKHRDSKEPFCLLVHHKAPHGLYEYPAEYASLYKNTNLPEPETFNDDYNGKDALANGNAGFSKLENIYSFHLNEPVPEGMKKGTQAYKEWTYQNIFKGYYRLVKSLDDNVGRLLDYLKASGQDKNTIIVYTSDNGFFLGDHGLFNKMWMYDESLKIPLIVSYPGHIKENAVDDRMISELDFGPTFLDYANAKVPSTFQGLSMKPLLERKKNAPWRKYFYYHYFSQFEVPEHYGIRTDNYKLINFVDPKYSTWELYDLKKDPKEMVNLIGNPKYKKLAEELKTELLQAKKKFDQGKG